MKFKDVDYSNQILKELTNLRKFGNELLSTTSTINFRNLDKEIIGQSLSQKEEYINTSFKEVLNTVVQKAFKIIDNNLFPQVISIFLFAKSGYLERYQIYINYPKNLTDKNFVPNERYRKGESFSGRSASGDPYGEPYFSNNLDLVADKLTNGPEYDKQLEGLKCGITVPLDSTHRTFGTLEVINRINPETKRPDSNLLYSEIEVFWLTVLGGHLARSISRIRKKQEEFVITEITKLLVDNNRVYNSEQVYQTIVNQLVSDLTPFKACILRFLEGKSLLVAKTASTDDIDMDAKKNSTRRIGEGMVGATCETKEPTIKHVDEHPEEFKSRPWIISQGLKSFICFPLLVQNESVGTLSLFTGYKHSFNDSDLDFLTNISNLLAAYKVGLNRKMSDAKKDDNNNEDNDNLREYLKQQFLLFQKNLPNLRKEYLNKYVHFHNGEVMDSDEDEIALLKRIYSKVENDNPQEVFVEQVTDDELSSETWDYLPLQ